MPTSYIMSNRKGCLDALGIIAKEDGKEVRWIGKVVGVHHSKGIHIMDTAGIETLKYMYDDGKF